MPAREICGLARARGILTLWDGCQALGQFPVDLHETGCDFYATNGYKWLLSPMGTGFLYVRKGAQQFLRPLRQPHAPDGTARQYETGTPASALYLGLGAGLDFLAGVGGPQPIAAEAGRKAESLRERLGAIPGVRINGSRRAETRTGVVAFSVEGMDGNEVSDALRNRWQIAQRGDQHQRTFRCSDFGGVLHQRLGAGYAGRSGHDTGSPLKEPIRAAAGPCGKRGSAGTPRRDRLVAT